MRKLCLDALEDRRLLLSAGIVATPDVAVQPELITLAVSASGQDAVYLYHESNGVPGLQNVGDQYIHGGYEGFSVEVSASSYSLGTQVFYAEAMYYDDFLQESFVAVAADSVVVVNEAPAIGSFTSDRDPAVQPETFTLTAAGVTGVDNAINTVYFYHESNGQPGLQFNDQYLGGISGDQSSYAVTLSSSDFSLGSHTFYAEVFDVGALNNRSVAALAMQIHNQSPRIDRFTATPGAVDKPGDFTLHVESSDPDNDLSVVYLYRESNGTPGLQFDDQYLTYTTDAVFSTTLSSAGLARGTHQFYAEAVDVGGARGTAAATLQVVERKVVGRALFYNNSALDGNNPAADAGDDGAIATDKAALLPGQFASLANYSSYSKGINGLLVDLTDLPGTPTASDFVFRTGNNNAPASWPVLATSPSVTVRPGAGIDGSTRVTLIWPDGAVAKRWLQVTVLASANTGLPSADVFYFGNAVGESGNATADAVVNATDEIGARTHPVGPFPNAAVTNLYDFNRDRLVNATDQIIARTSGTNPLTALRLISVPAESGSGFAATDRALVGLAAQRTALESDPSTRRRRR